MKKKFEEKLDVIKIRTVNDYLKKEGGKEIQSSGAAAEALHYVMNNFLKELVKKTISNAKDYRKVKRIDADDVFKALEEIKK